jgi:hypothetical protein
MDIKALREVLTHAGMPSSPEVRRSAQRGLDQPKLQNGKKARANEVAEASTG